MGFNAQSGSSAADVRINRSIFVENYASSSHLVCRVRWCVSFMLGVSRLSTQADAAPAALTRVSDQAYGGVMYISTSAYSAASIYLYQNVFETNFASSNQVVRLRGHTCSWSAHWI